MVKLSDKDKAGFGEELTINGETIVLTHAELPLEMVELDDDNPRVRYRLSLERNGKSLEEVVLGMSEVKSLKKDIEKTGGLRERVIVRENGGGRWKVVEGNCRRVCYEELHAKHPDDPRWSKIPVRILPKDIDPKFVAILLTDF